jgi:hypothetical protein
MHPLVVNVKRDPYDVYIGRGTKWGNPFRIGVDGTREEVLEKHRNWLPHQKELMAAMHELRGKRLGCHCAPRDCHGDLLAALANPPAAPMMDYDRRQQCAVQETC